VSVAERHTVLVTGATGFVGTALLERLSREPQFRMRAAVRASAPALSDAAQVVVGDIGASTSWGDALIDVTSIVHLAARVHVMHDTAENPLAAFRAVNVAGTLALARQAADAGVERFVFLSSVKVNGETGRFSETDIVAPSEPYGVSKCEAEVGLREIARTSGMSVVIVRPPLVYGPGVKANFRTLQRAVRRGLMLPLGAVHNRRSLVAVGNLVDLIVVLLTHPRAANETFFVSDGDDLSTTELVELMARAMDRPARLLPVPVFLLKLAATIVGKRDVAQRVLGSLQVDITKARTYLGWVPPLSVVDALRLASDHT
jgi:nucleoside-diphosphate-sugar epimerase